MGVMLISTVSAADNTTQTNTTDNILTTPEETIHYNISSNEKPIISEENNLNPDVQIYYEDGLIGFQAPTIIYDNLNLWINNVNYGHSCDLINKYGIIKEATVKNNQGEIVAVKNINWNNLKFTLNGKTVTLTNDEYQSLKDHLPIQKYVGVKKTKYISKYNKVKKTFYKTKLLGKAYRSVIGAIVMSKIIGIDNTIKYFKQVDKNLNKKVKKQIKKMKKKGWKFDYTYKKSKNGVYKIYGEFHKVKKVKTPVYKYKTSNNYMIFKFSSGKYIVQVDSNDNKYTYSNSFGLI